MSIKMVFILEGRSIDICGEPDEMVKGLLLKYSAKISKDIKELIFLCRGNDLNPNQKLKDIIQPNADNNEIKILVYEKNNVRKEENKLIKSKYIICPTCKKNCVIKMNNYKISLEECDENHNSTNILLEKIDDYNNTQLINQSNIICSICKNNNKGDTFGNTFYKCFTCKKDICPLCREIHNKNNKDHYVIDYDEQNFVCNKEKHINERYTSYCKECHKNLCLICEANHDKKHSCISFRDLINENNLDLEEYENIYNKFKNEINNLKNILLKVEKNLGIYFTMINDIKNNYMLNKRNYQILKSAKNIHEYNNNLIKEMKKIINESNQVNKFTDIIQIYNKMTENDNINDNINNENNNNDNNNNILNLLLNKSNSVSIPRSTNEININLEDKKGKTGRIDLIQFNEGTEFSFGSVKKYKSEEIKDTDEIIIKYVNNKNENDIILLGDKFIHNNKDNCRLFIKGKQVDLKKSYNKKKYNLTKQIIEVKLKIDSQLTDMSYMFKDCSSIVSITDLHLIDTSRVTNMSYLFCDCKSLTSLPDISNWDTSNVINMKYLFGGCNSLEEFPDISSWDTSKVTDMSYMFCDCIEIEKLPDISKWSTSIVTNFSGMFSGCRKLISLPNLNNWNCSKVSDASYMFSQCSSLSQSFISNIKFGPRVKKDFFYSTK